MPFWQMHGACLENTKSPHVCTTKKTRICVASKTTTYYHIPVDIDLQIYVIPSDLQEFLTIAQIYQWRNSASRVGGGHVICRGGGHCQQFTIQTLQVLYNVTDPTQWGIDVISQSSTNLADSNVAVAQFHISNSVYGFLVRTETTKTIPSNSLQHKIYIYTQL